MAINTYATLQTAVISWLDRSDMKTGGELEGKVPEFIALAEALFNRALRIRAM